MLVQEFISSGSLPDNVLETELLKTFWDLPCDPYMRGGDNYRYRAFGRGVLERGGIDWVNDTNFFQSEDLNSYQGGVGRHFAPLSKVVKQCIPCLISYMPEVKRLIGECKCDLGCHQIRITSSTNKIGKPAPEGFHKDGFDYVAIVSVDKNNLCGGVTLVKDEEGGELVYESELEQRSYVFLDDRRCLHYTSPVVGKVPGVGYRDVFVFTFLLKDVD